MKSNWTKAEYALLYEKKDGKGSYRCFADDVLANDLGTPGWNFDNQGSSVALIKGNDPGCGA